jgi:hypothetical protein
MSARQHQVRNVKAGRCWAHKDRPIYKAQMCEQCYEKVKAKLDARRKGNAYLTAFGRLLAHTNGLSAKQKTVIIKAILDGTAKDKLAAAIDNPKKIDQL